MYRYLVEVFLIDGTYELFRHYHALPRALDLDGVEVGAVRGVLRSMLGMMKGGATHIAVATDHVIESFRNEMWAGYKTSAGMPPDLLSQFPLLEEVLSAAGIPVWPMVEFEADDALAAGAHAAVLDDRVSRVVICTPDKDVAQCVRGKRVVQMDRKLKITRDEEGIIAKFGVRPQSIPDYLALVGDSADGYPGLPGWGAKSAAAALAKFHHIEHIPPDTPSRSLAQTLSRNRELAFLFRDLATLRTDIPLFSSVDDLCWNGPNTSFDALARRLDAAKTVKKVESPQQLQTPR